ncbi:MAG: stage II sporulation protein SpoIID [Firmicutes bacterium HGW-Firmicutes-12]|jgi:stage II sporulation protein D|nr:MAG: stage II sporulation protein SpoIID [Firmicutes bacterium HGW-Firmicutes-12]
MKKTNLLVIFLLCFQLLAFTSCGVLQRPEKSEIKEEPTISLYVAETGEKKQLKMEDYLKGVVAAEMDPSWPLEALAAQAIIARTFTLERMQNGEGVPARGTDASTNPEEFQAYDARRINENVNKAVERTRGEIVTYQGKYIKAWFFADGGGQTAASAQEGLAYGKQPSPYIKSVSDPGAEITIPENKSWQISFPLDVVRQSVKEATGKDTGDINQVNIVEKGPSGRATSIKVGNVVVSGPAFRLALGSEKMRSTLITDMRVEANNLIVSGKGFGHGVGMSQWGAKALASQGKKAEQIIEYFFKDVQIKKEWD